MLQRMSAYDYEKQSTPLPVLGFSLAENTNADNEKGLYIIKVNSL